MRATVTFGELFGARLATRLGVSTLFSSIIEIAPVLIPTRFGYHEPLGRHFSLDAIAEAAEKLTTGPLIWNRRSPASEGTLFPRSSASPFDSLYLSAGSISEDMCGRLVELLIDLGDEFDGHFGYVHPAVEGQAALPDYANTLMPFQRGLAWKRMEVRLPSVAWGMLFGTKMTEKIGRAKLLASPVFRAEELNGRIYVQITEKAGEVVTLGHESARRDLVRYLGPDVVAQSETV